MKRFLAIGIMLLIGAACFASGPASKDGVKASASFTRLQTEIAAYPATVYDQLIIVDQPFAGTIPELGTPLNSAMLEGYKADIWHPPVLNSILWLSSIKIHRFCDYPRLDGSALNCRSDKLINPKRTNLTDVFHICWFDIA